jgi:hypothetical protein
MTPMLDRTAALLRDVPRRRVNHSRSVIRAINDIRVGKRHRRDMGDIAGLAQEIAKLGLLHPVVVTSDNKLIAGAPRLEACKALGWSTDPRRFSHLAQLAQGWSYRLLRASVQGSFSQMRNSMSIRRRLLPCAQDGDARVASSQPAPKALPIRAELIGSDTCTAMGIIARAHAPVLTLCRLLIEAGHNPTARLEAYRGSTLCLTVRSIEEGATLRTASHGVGFEWAPDAQEPRTSRKTPNPISDSRRPAAAHPGASGAISRTTGPTKVAGAARHPKPA